MTTPESIKATDATPARDLLVAAGHYLGNRRTLVILGVLLLVAGIVLNWSWLVAVGVAPILLSTLPCLVMCGLGVCMMCRSGDKQSTTPREAADAATPPAALGIAKPDRPFVAASCCGVVGDTQAPQAQSLEERRKSHA